MQGVTGRFQGMDFLLSTSTPITINASLFGSADCNVSQSPWGADNMNDYGQLTGSTHTVQGFTHHHDAIPSSAIFWAGPLTADGMCPPGYPCSGCVNYTDATPDCQTMP